LHFLQVMISVAALSNRARWQPNVRRQQRPFYSQRLAAMSGWAVSQLLEIAHRLAATLETSAGEDTDEDPLAEALHAEGIDPDQLMRRLGRSVVEDEAMAAAMKARIEGLAARRDRWLARAAHKRGALSVVMQTLNQTRFVDTDFTASIRPSAGGAVIIADEDVPTLPPEYQRVTVAADRPAIKAALLDGVVVPGAALTQGGEPVLSIRRS
jgi:hypothetical protein